MLRSFVSRRSYLSTTLPSLQTTQPGTVYGGISTVTLIPGDGVGIEMAESVKQIFKAAACPVEFEQFDLSGHTLENEGLALQAITSVRRNKVALKGILHTPLSLTPGGPVSYFFPPANNTQSVHSWNVSMRKELDIYASVSLLKNTKGQYPTRYSAAYRRSSNSAGTRMWTLPLSVRIQRENIAAWSTRYGLISHPDDTSNLAACSRRRGIFKGGNQEQDRAYRSLCL